MSVKPFLNDNFLLQSKTAELLYHKYAAPQPIIDYHNHLPPDQIVNDHAFSNITQVWLAGDHYKWRAMRALGINERYITGDASDREKFIKWSEVVPYTMRNPLYHWTHLELQRYFNINDLLSSDNADKIYDETKEMLNSSEYSTRKLIIKQNVKVVCTTDDPIDSLEHHIKGKQEQMGFKMLPAFRPDKAILISSADYLTYVNKLSQAADIEITNYDDLHNALNNRLDYFHTHGCRLADHGLSRIYASDYTESRVKNIFERKLKGETISESDAEAFMSDCIYRLGIEYAKRGWVQQFHLGALRNNNERMLRDLGPDTGFDSIGDFEQAYPLSKLLNRLDNSNMLAKTILYNLNPRDNEVFAAMIGNYNDGSIKGKMQYGSAWWFLDQKDGMEKQINALSNMGLLSCFIGMLTDSRSFLSFPRHEYFRRILCNMIGNDVENGELPYDTKWLGKLVADISYRNAEAYFNF